MNEHKLALGFLVAIYVAFVASVGVGIIYVAAHFIAKFW